MPKHTSTTERLAAIPLLVMLAMAWAGGILLGADAHFEPLIPLCGAGAMVLLTVLVRRHRWGRLTVLLVLCFCLGVWRYVSIAPENDPQSIFHAIGTNPLRLRGAVIEMPQSYGQSHKVILEATSVRVENASTWKEVHGLVEIHLMGTASTFHDTYGEHYGDVLELRGKLQPATSYSSPEIVASMAFPVVSKKGTDSNSLIEALYELRGTLAEIIKRTLPQPQAALLLAIVLGMDTPDLHVLKQAFNSTGTTHLLVASGSNISLLAGLFTASTARFMPGKDQSLLPREKRWHWKYILVTTGTMIVIIAYTILCGAGLPVIRAGIMGILLVLAPRLGRHYSIYTALGFALIAMTAIEPRILWDVSFQLSYLSVAGIVLISPYLQYALRRLKSLPAGQFIVDNLAVTLASQIATLPILVVAFHQISPVSPLANILVVLCIEFLLPAGLLLCGCGLIFMPLATLCGWIVWPFLAYVITIICWCAQLPEATIFIEGFDTTIYWSYYNLLTIVLFYLMSAFPLSSLSTIHVPPSPIWKHALAIMIAAIIVITGLNVLSPPVNNETTITFLGVGSIYGPSQGEAILIRTPPDKTLLIDGGPDTTTLAQELDSRLPSWQRSLDLVLLTCPRPEHMNAQMDIIDRYSIGTISDGGMLHPTTTYDRWQRTIREHNIAYVRASVGTTFTPGPGTTLQVLWPPTNLHKGSNEVRDNSMIVQLIIPGVRILLVGASAQSTYALTNFLARSQNNDVQADIVQVIGEVGKPASKELITVLRKAHPSLLIVTPAAQRKIDDTSQSVPLDMVYQGSSLTAEQIISTAQNGTAEITSDEHGWHLATTAEQ